MNDLIADYLIGLVEDFRIEEKSLEQLYKDLQVFIDQKDARKKLPEYRNM